MEWLKNIALPQSADHIELLGYLLVLVMLIFITFISIILWGTIISIYLKKKETKDLNITYSRLSRVVMDIVLFNKTTGIMFCILPLITILIILAQLFQLQNNPNLDFLGYSLLFLLISLLLIYSYKNSLYDFRQVDINSGLFGSIFLFISLWLFSAALTNSIFTETSNALNASLSLFSSAVLIRFLILLFISLAIAGSVLIFGIFKLKDIDPKEDAEYTSLAKAVFLKAAFIASVFLPLFILFDMTLLPKSSLSGAFFFHLILGLVFLFIAYHLLYLLYQKLNKTIAAYLLTIIILFVITYVVNDQMLIAKSNRIHYSMLSSNYENYLAELKGVDKTPAINAQEIYKVSCTSCHAFDRKLVGPPHNEVIPKYFGKENQLVAFIRNPVRVNDKYPPMPNPGLKPDEAKAVAEYLLSKVKDNLGK